MWGRTTDRDRSWPGVLVGVAALLTVAALAGWIARRRTQRRVDRLVATLLSDAGAGTDRPEGDGERADRSGNAGERADRPVTTGDLAGLPDPVARYFDAVLEEGQLHARTARIEQRGEIDLGKSNWKPFRAVQHVAVDPPGFVWDARVRMLPGVGARVVDSYVRGEGALRGRLGSVLPVVDVPPGPDTDESELLRYLGEAVWVPTALLSGGVEWDPIDDDSARATVADGDRTASLVFHFDDRGLVDRVHAEKRYRQEIDDHVPWTGHFRKYRERNGVLVPTEAEVEWDPPEGGGTYWRASVESIEYGVGSNPP